MHKTLFILFLILSCSSPYYNTFYNAEISFRKGEIAYLKRNINTTSNFKSADLQKAIKKCVAVLQRYGKDSKNNSYADDAYFMIAKASYYLADYFNTIEAITSLDKYAPYSEFYNPSRVFLWNAHIKLQNMVAAKEILLTVNKKTSPLLFAKSQLSLADIHRENKQLIDEKEKLKVALHTIQENDDRTDNLQRLNDILIKKIFLNNFQRNDLNDMISDLDLFESIHQKPVKLYIYNIIIELLASQKESNEIVNSWLLNLESDIDFRDNIANLNYLHLCRSFFKRDSLRFFSVFNVMQENQKKKLQAKPQYMLAKYYDLILSNIDSSLYFYGKSVSRLETIEVKRRVIKRKNFLQRYKKIIDRRKILYNEIQRLQNFTDSLTQESEDSLNQENLVKITKKTKLLNALFLDEAIFKYETDNFNEAENLFKKYITLSNDSGKLATAYLYIASIIADEDSVKADSIYHFVYKNFKSQQNNQVLRNKISIKNNEKNFTDKKIYDHFLNSFDIAKIPALQFYQKSLPLKLDSNSFEREKLDYIFVSKRISEANRKDTIVIQDILKFKKKHPKSLFLTELNKYELTLQSNTKVVEKDLFPKKFQEKEDEKIILSDKKFLEKNEKDIILKSKKVTLFASTKKLSVKVKLSLNKLGNVTNVEILTPIDDKSLKAKLHDICKKWKFNQSFKEERYYYSIFKIIDAL